MVNCKVDAETGCCTLRKSAEQLEPKTASPGLNPMGEVAGKKTSQMKQMILSL